MADIEKLERLSKLEFTEEERAAFEAEFSGIIEFVDEIKGIELPDGLDKDNAISLSSLRADEPKESMPREKVLENAPKQKDGEFVTPLVVE